MVSALQWQLRSLRREIERLPPDVYRGVSGTASGSIGQHVRHVLDHASALLAAPSAASFTYDARLRGTRVETDAACAADEIVRACIALEALDDVPFDRALRLTLATGAEGAGEVVTSVGREIAFVLQHTIHHCALVAVLLERAGLAVPPRFGLAPSTPARA